MPVASHIGSIVLRFCLLILGGALLLGEAQAEARDEKPLKIVVPLGAGGTTDRVAHLIADRLRALTGRAVLVENRPGALGRIAVRALKDAPQDGQTMLMAPIAVPVLIPLLARKLEYDPSELEPISQIAEYPIAFAVPTDHPATTLREYIDWARAQPRGTVFGSPGAGGLPDLLSRLLAQAASFNLEHVAYRSAAPLATDLAGGHIPAGASALSDFIALHRAGKLRILATSGKQRSALAADIPTFVEQGYPAVHGVAWTALVVLKGTSRKDIETLSNWVQAIVHSPEVQEHLRAAGLEPTGTSPEGLAAIIAADIKRWRPVVERSGIVLE